MTGPTSRSIVRALLDPRPSHPPSARDMLRRRGGEVAELRVDLADLRSERDRILAENVRLSAELASVIAERDELRAGVEDLHERLDSAAKQRNTAKFWVRK